MSNKIIILWATIIIVIITSIFLIGKYHEKNYKYYETNKEVKLYLKRYIEEENIKIDNFNTIIIDSEELKDKKYFEEIKVNYATCEFVAKIKNYVIFKAYKIKYECINDIKE